MSYGLLSLGVQGARASQSGLAVVGNNITNVNTPGYTRQVAQFNSLEEGGVVQDSTRRVVDQYINARLWADTSRFEAAQAYEQLSNQLDNLLASDSTSLAVKMDDYFAALQSANDDPISLTNRELFLAEADALVRRYHELYDRVAQINETVNTRIRELTQQVTVTAGEIADLNDRIRVAEASGKDAFELKDQRDEAIKSLSGLVDIQVLEQPKGDMNIFVGNGQPLVVGQSAYQFVARGNEFDPSRYDVGVVIAGEENIITDMLAGGELGGLLTYRRETMDQSLNELGRLAITFADTMNAQHQKGMDYDGEMGKRLYNDMNSSELMASRFRSRFDAEGTVAITDSSQLRASEYELVFTAQNDFRLTRLSDGKSWTQSSFSSVASEADVDAEGKLWFDPSNGELNLQIDGFRLDANTNGAFAPNEKLMLSPVRRGAEEIELNIRNGRDLALAAPVTIAPAAANTGTATAEVRIEAIDDTSEADPVQVFPELPLQLSYDAIADAWSVTDNDGTTPASWSVSADPTQPNLLQITDQATGRTVMEVEVSGQFRDNDQFTIDYNFDLDATGQPINIGVSDNRNGLLMSDLLKQATSLEGSYQESYGRLVERVGTDTKVAQMDRQASEAVLRNMTAQRESVSGVNLDEEAVKLIQFQQAYQASAQIIRASQTIFDALIQAV
jgi:flagellar hook-associated protein 1 FlgK